MYLINYAYKLAPSTVCTIPPRSCCALILACNFKEFNSPPKKKYLEDSVKDGYMRPGVRGLYPHTGGFVSMK